VGVAQIVRAPVCDTGGWQGRSAHPPQWESSSTEELAVKVVAPP